MKRIISLIFLSMLIGSMHFVEARSRYDKMIKDCRECIDKCEKCIGECIICKETCKKTPEYTENPDIYALCVEDCDKCIKQCESCIKNVRCLQDLMLSLQRSLQKG